ncbi:MAG: energy-coupling factor transporter transmembrane component T family protein [Candidatus Ornithomonoglobus sp.]
MLRDITIGRYIDTKSPLHHADARTKILAAVAYSVVVFTINSYAGMGLVFVFTAAAVLVSKIPAGYMLKGLKPLRLFMIFTFVMALFTGSGNPLWQWHIFKITASGIHNSIIVTLRFIFFVAGTSLLTLTTPPVALTDGLARLMKPLKALKVPVDDIAMIISVTLRFIPLFGDEAERIMKAQKARGADFSGGGLISKARAIIPVTIPLFISVFRHADELALAMDARCYGKGTRNPRKKTHFGKTDACIAFITIIFCIFFGIIGFLH